MTLAIEPNCLTRRFGDFRAVDGLDLRGKTGAVVVGGARIGAAPPKLTPGTWAKDGW
jgi:hypothetical protein